MRQVDAVLVIAAWHSARLHVRLYVAYVVVPLRQSELYVVASTPSRACALFLRILCRCAIGRFDLRSRVFCMGGSRSASWHASRRRARRCLATRRCVWGSSISTGTEAGLLGSSMARVPVHESAEAEGGTDAAIEGVAVQQKHGLALQCSCAAGVDQT